MQKTILFLSILAFVANVALAQTDYYTKYYNLGIAKYKAGEYLNALEHFDAAYKFADTEQQKDKADAYKQKCRDGAKRQQAEIKQQKADLEIALKEAEEAKAESDSLLNVANLALAKAEEMQTKEETAVFDKAVKERNKDWKGYANYYWRSDYLEETKKGLEILSKIDSLDLSNNALLRLPKEIAECPNLKHINLLGNPNIDWNDCFEKVEKTGINSVYVSVNDLSDIGQEYWKYVTGIEISGNELQKIPENILQQKQLTYLDLRDNKLTILPHEIGELTNLSCLILYSNQLTNLPHEIGKLTNLTLLGLDVNKLSSLPAEIGNLTSLEYLSLSGDNFTEEEKQKIKSWFEGTKCEIKWY